MIYTFQLYKPETNTWVEVNPIHSGCTLNAVREGIRKRINFNGKLIFYGSEFSYLYLNYLNELFQYDFRVLKNGAVYVTGKLSAVGKYDLDKKTCELTFKVIDKYYQLQKEWEKEYNILSQTKNTIQLTGTSQSFTFFNEDMNPGVYPKPDAPENFIIDTVAIPPAWNATTYYIPFYRPDGEYRSQCIVTYQNKHYKCTNSNTGQIPSSNSSYWSEVDYIAYTQQRINFKATDDFVFDENILCYVHGSRYPVEITANFNNCLKLYDVLKYLSDQTYTFVSISETNFCTWFATVGISKVFISQKSDIKRYKESNPATICNFTLKRFLEIIKTTFNLDWYLTDANEFRLLHAEEIEFNGTGVDLTTLKGTDWSLKKREFEQDSDKFIGRETWKFETSTKDFDTLELNYLSIDEANSKEYQISDINNNLTFVMDGNESVADTGIVFLAADNQNEILTYNDKINGHFSADGLLECFLKYDRPYSKTIDYKNLVKGYAKKLNDIAAPTVDINELDFNKFVKTTISDETIIQEYIENIDGNNATYKLIMK